MSRVKEAPLLTPDGRYLVVRGRLWRRANPALPEAERLELVRALMVARRAVATAQRQDDAQRLREARAAVQRAKGSRNRASRASRLFRSFVSERPKAGSW